MSYRAGRPTRRLIRVAAVLGLFAALAATLASGVLAGESFPGPVDHFTFDEIGATQTAGTAFAVTVTAYDSEANVVTDYSGPATFSGLGNSLGGCAPSGNGPCSPIYNLSFVNGVASGQVTAFKAEANVAITVQDNTNLSAQGTSNTFSVGPADPQNVVFGQQPTRTLINTVITPSPTVVVRDLYHNTATQATNSVTMAIGTNPGGGTLGGTTSKAPVAGVATFNNLSINKSGGGFTLVASTAVTGGTATKTSNPFDIPLTIVNCPTGGCSATATNSNTTVQVTVPAQTGPARVLAGSVDSDVAISIDAAAGSFNCGGAGTAIGAISTVDPPAGYTSANGITVQVVYDRIVPKGVGGVSKFVLCKDSGFGTPFAVVPKCAKKNPVAPCEIHRSAVGRAGLKFVLLITSVDPRLASK